MPYRRADESTPTEYTYALILTKLQSSFSTLKKTSLYPLYNVEVHTFFNIFKKNFISKGDKNVRTFPFFYEPIKLFGLSQIHLNKLKISFEHFIFGGEVVRP